MPQKRRSHLHLTHSPSCEQRQNIAEGAYAYQDRAPTMYVSGCDMIPVKIAGSLVSKRQNAGRRDHELTLIDVSCDEPA